MFKLIKKILCLLPLFIFNSIWAMDCIPKYDILGIPHQETSSQEHFYFCFGYHHGHDRAWEMDFLRRISQGRNAEVLGYAHLKSDLMMRLLNLPERAQKLWDNFPEADKKIIQNYVDGVNAGFKTGKLAQEFVDLGIEPEAWTAVNTLSVLLTQSFDQTRKTFYKDYQEEQARETWGDKAASLFDHDGIPWENTVLKKGEYPVKPTEQKTSQSSPRKKIKLWAPFPTLFGEHSGSNNWVISPMKSKTGKAILANDPHLDLKTPLFWYWIHLKSPEVEMIGGSLPGVPIIASGTNGKVGWGLTNSYINTADAILLKDSTEDLFETIRPLVWIKFGFLKIPFFFKSFERLKTGQPVLPLELKQKEKLVLRWTGFSVAPQDVAPMLHFGQVGNVEEMDEVLKQIGIPAWNFVFADTKGGIGFRLVGKCYKHTSRLKFGVPLMTLDEFRNEEFLTPMERPHLLNPKRGYVHTANNRHWPEDAQFYGGRGYSHSFRAFRIDELLEGKHDQESFKAIQCDSQVVDARFFIPKILNFVASPVLAGWKFQSNESSGELSIYRRLMDIMMDEWKVDEYALFRLLDKLDEKQHREIKEFYARAVKDVRERSWGEFHRLGFSHLSNNERWVFSPEMPGIGDTHSVNPGTSKWNPDKQLYQQFSGASMRMIIEMDERPKILLALPGLNREYTLKGERTPWQDWKSCKYTEVTY